MGKLPPNSSFASGTGTQARSYTSTAGKVKVQAPLTSSDLKVVASGDSDHYYRDAVNAPVSVAAILALRDRLKSGEVPRRKVRKRT